MTAHPSVHLSAHLSCLHHFLSSCDIFLYRLCTQISELTHVGDFLSDVRPLEEEFLPVLLLFFLVLLVSFGVFVLESVHVHALTETSINTSSSSF